MTWADAGWAFLRVVIVLAFLLGTLPFVIWGERRVLAWFQDRIGPNRLGPFGLLQPIADVVKLFFKEEFLPKAADYRIWFIAPALALFPAVVAAATIPWGPNRQLTPVADIDVGILYFLAMSSLAVYGVVLAGWSSNNKYSLLGGLRSSAQLISYELGMGLALGAIILSSGTLRMTGIVEAQDQPLWGIAPAINHWFIFTPWGFIGAVIFWICMVAETNRAPFDLPEAESELIAGYHTEYSSMKFAVFFMSEYMAMVTISAILATCFLGGYLPPLDIAPVAALAESTSGTALGGITSALATLTGWLSAPFWFISKIVLSLFIFIWLRATLPRLRYDQLMALGWKALFPLALVNLMIAAVYFGFGWIPALTGYGILALGYALWVINRRGKEPKRVVQMHSDAAPYQPQSHREVESVG
ncbi:MAG: NADH-quinone oxidoreductase subunit NuoH [Fimbriimonadia bacterium]|nr:NADH-quinone oxidoreductase subunit NuoH [Fimbriimonadia bacterium]